MKMRIVTDPFNSSVWSVEPQRIETGNSGEPADALIERSSEQSDLRAKRVAHQVDALRIDLVHLRKRINSGARVGHHLSHQ